MSETVKTDKKEGLIQQLFEMGAHFGFSRRRRHPSTGRFVYGYKNNNAVIDLEQTTDALARAEDFVRELGRNRQVIIFVGNKAEARLAVKKAAATLDMPYVAERWIGGTFTNFKEIKKRVARLKWLKEAEVSGELSKYTKKERLLLARERKDLERYFEGIIDMEKMPKAMFVIDVGAEDIAVKEAKLLKIPVITLSNSDCDIRDIEYPIVGNDSSRQTIAFFTDRIVNAYQAGLKEAPVKTEDKSPEAAPAQA